MEKEVVKAYSPLVLAYMGDAVCEQIIREKLVTRDHSRPAALNRRCARIVCAAGQARLMAAILEELTEEEEAVSRRGRNAHSPTMAKNQSVHDYRIATGFEALCGYLHLSGSRERLIALIDKGLAAVEPDLLKMSDTENADVHI